MQEQWKEAITRKAARIKAKEETDRRQKEEEEGRKRREQQKEQEELMRRKQEEEAASKLEQERAHNNKRDSLEKQQINTETENADINNILAKTNEKGEAELRKTEPDTPPSIDKQIDPKEQERLERIKQKEEELEIRARELKQMEEEMERKKKEELQ